MLLNSPAPRGQELSFPVNTSKDGARFTSISDDGIARTSVRTILPNEYARQDAGTPALWELMCSTSLKSLQDSESCSEYFILGSATVSMFGLLWLEGPGSTAPRKRSKWITCKQKRYRLLRSMGTLSTSFSLDSTNCMKPCKDDFLLIQHAHICAEFYHTHGLPIMKFVWKRRFS